MAPEEESTTLIEEGEEREEEEEEEEESERLAEIMKERMVTIKTMSKELKAFTVLTAACIISLAVLALMRNHAFHNMVVSTSFSEEGDKSAAMPQIVFLLSVLFVSIGWSLAVTAASRAGWITRVAVLGALALGFGTERTAASYVNLSTTLIAAGLCTVIVAILVLTWFPERGIHHEKDPITVDATGSWKVLRKLVFPVCLIVFLAIYGVIWHESRVQGIADNFPSSFADQLSNIQWILVPIIYLAGADFGDWGNFASGRLIRRVRLMTSDTWFMVIGFVVAAAIAADGIRISYSDDGYGVVTELVVGAVLLAITVLLVLVAKPNDKWPTSFPFLVLVSAVVADTLASYIISTRVTNDPDGTKADGWDAIVWFSLAVVGLILITAFRKKFPNWLVIGALYAALIGAFYVATDLSSVGAIVHPFGINENNAPAIWYEGIKATAAIAAMVAIVVTVVMKKVKEWTQPVALIVCAAVAMQVLSWIDSLYGKTGTVTGSLALAAGIVLVLALSWEFATSGESVTNGHRPRFPRDTRVLVFLGYILITGTTSIFFSGIHEYDDGKLGKLVESQFEAESFVRDGLAWLATPLVVLIFIVAFNRWRQQRLSLPDEQVHQGKIPA